MPSPQVNLDFEDEADMVQMARLGIALQPIATALFANSPFRDGKPTGYLSWRSHVWTGTVRVFLGLTLCWNLCWQCSFLAVPIERAASAVVPKVMAK